MSPRCRINGRWDCLYWEIPKIPRARTGDFLVRRLDEAGATASTQSFVATLEQNGFSCRRSNADNTCVGNFFRTERVSSGSPNDGVYRSHWLVRAQWRDSANGVRPEITGGRTKVEKLSN
jgi:hypothetical protein